MGKNSLSWGEVFNLKPHQSLPTGKKVEEIIQKVFGINPSPELRNKVLSFYEDIAGQELTNREIVGKFLVYPNFFFKKEPDFKSLEVLILKPNESVPSTAKMQEILSYLELLFKTSISGKLKDSLTDKIHKIYSEGKVPTAESFKEVFQIQNASEEIIDAQKSQEIFAAKRKELVQEKILKLKTLVNENFMNGKSSFIITLPTYKEFEALGSENELQDFLLSLEHKNYFLTRSPEGIVVAINQSKDEDLVSKFKTFMTKTFTSNKFDVKKFLDKEFSAPTLTDDQFFLGVKDNGQPNIQNFIQCPGALFCGGMGSGKSIANRASVALKAIGSQNTLVFILDPLKGATDYAQLFVLDHVVPLVNDMSYVAECINLTFEELMARKDALASKESSNIKDYEDKTGQKLSRIVLAIEEFHVVPHGLNYHLDSDKEGTVAYKLKTLIRIGRSYGIWIMASTQRATSDDLPSSLKPGLTNLMAFRTNNLSDVMALNLPHAGDISIQQRGRAAIDDGQFVQFPYISDEELKKAIKDTEAKRTGTIHLLTMTQEFLKSLKKDQRNILSVKTDQLESALSKQEINLPVLKQVLEFFDYGVSVSPSKVFPVEFKITASDNKKVAVMVSSRESLKSKVDYSMTPIIKKALQVEEVWLVDLDSDVPSSFQSELQQYFDKFIAKAELMTMINFISKSDHKEVKKYFEEMHALMPLSQKGGKV